jgi:hypothetical protein
VSLIKVLSFAAGYGRSVMKLFILPGLFLFMTASFFLPGESFALEDGTVVIDAEFNAPVKQEDGAEARNDVLRGALQKAVEQATGSLLTPELMREKGKILRSDIFLKADQYIHNYRIISEKAYAGIYTLLVRVTVSLDGIKNDLRTLGMEKELTAEIPSEPVLITFRGINHYQDYLRLKEFMKTGIKGVKEMRPRSLAWGTACLEVYIQGGAVVMTAELAKVKQYPIKATRAGDNAIEVVFIR